MTTAETKAERDAAEERAKDLMSGTDSVKNTLAVERNELASQLEEANAKLQTAEAEEELAITSAQSTRCGRPLMR